MQEVSSPVGPGQQRLQAQRPGRRQLVGRALRARPGQPQPHGLPALQRGRRALDLLPGLPAGQLPDRHARLERHVPDPPAGRRRLPADLAERRGRPVQALQQRQPPTTCSTPPRSGTARRSATAGPSSPLHIMNSPDDNKGFVELYGDLDGERREAADAEDLHAHDDDRADGAPMTNHARIGIYRNPGHPRATRASSSTASRSPPTAQSAEAAAFGDARLDAPQMPATSTPPTSNPSRRRPRQATRRPRRRPRLRSAAARAASCSARAAGEGPVPVPPPGRTSSRCTAGSRDGKHLGARSVVIEIRQQRQLAVAQPGLAPEERPLLPRPGGRRRHGPQTVVLRAHVQRVGYSGEITAKV